MNAESAVRDRIGKGHNPDIAPLSGIVAKLKAQQAALAAKCVQLVSAVADLLRHCAGVTQQVFFHLPLQGQSHQWARGCRSAQLSAKRKALSPQKAASPPQVAAQADKDPGDDDDLLILSDEEASRDGFPPGVAAVHQLQPMDDTQVCRPHQRS